MRKVSKFLAGALISTSMLAVSVPALATEIAVVNIQTIMRDSTAAQSVREQLESKQKEYQAQIAKKEQSLQTEEKELAKQRGVLAKEAFEGKVEAFRKKATSTQQEVAKKKQKLDNGFEGALNDIQKSVSDIITELAAEKKFDVAVPTTQVLYAKPTMDISDDVLKRLNERLPKVKVDFE